MNEAESAPEMEQKCPQCGAPLPSGVLAGLCPACLFAQGAAADTAPPPDSAPFVPPGVAEMARLFPQLEIIALLGKGGMGAVYKARQPALDRIVALKILPSNTGGVGFFERFNREARALAKLNHPNIVTVYEFGQMNGLPFFIMEFVDGLNLRQLEQAGKLTPGEALKIVPQICEALQFAHDEGIVHRDIKPENILLDKKGRVKIADFGIAKILGRQPEASITETGGTVGTPHYMAPEQMEKPATVDHRADIFSLGVVFYEMLTGELPLGKFAPPSTRKVLVDVRLDDVVLRALEKDPELRYQHASQVKTAVDSIAGQAASPIPPPPPPVADAKALADEILARDYKISIRSCFRRSWALVKKDFWPLIGVTALILVLISFVSSLGGITVRTGAMGHDSGTISSLLTMLVWGPLMGGLSLYYLKKMRGQPVNIEVAFCGFTQNFLHLFLGGFVVGLLTWIGILCLILPGIYLMVAWWFTLTLIIDKRLDFWAAMELSRQVVTRHWWKLFGLFLAVLLTYAAGLLMCGVGLFIAAPIGMIAATYAYEDIFGQSASATGPSGTVVMPGTTAPARKPWSWTTKIALAVVTVLIIGWLGAATYHYNIKRHHRTGRSSQATAQVTSVPVTADTILAEPTNAPAPEVFGPVMERELKELPGASATNQFLNLDTAQFLNAPELPPLPEGTQPSNIDDQFWAALNVPRDGRRPELLAWMRNGGVDLAYAGSGKIIGFDDIFVVARVNYSTNLDDWDDLTPAQARAAVEMSDWMHRATEASLHGRAAPPAPAGGGVVNDAIRFDSGEPGAPVLSLLTRDESVNWFFKTRNGHVGILQIGDVAVDPPSVKIRYKLVQPGADNTNSTSNTNVTGSEITPDMRAAFYERLDAASNVNNTEVKDKLLSTLANDAAESGTIEIVSKSLAEMFNQRLRDEATLNVTRVLARRGMRKEAIELAKGISSYSIRDQTLSELAQ